MNTEQQEPMKTMNASGGVPATRIQDASAAHRLVSALARADEPRSNARAKTRGMLDGNPPYNPAELKRLGQSHRTNLNFREAAGYVKSRRSSYYDLVMGVPKLVQVTVRPEAASAVAENTGDDSAPVRFAEIISDEFHNLEMDWSGFLFHTLKNMGEMISYGVGPVFFPHETDWRFRAVAMGDVLVPTNAPANVEDMDVVAISTGYSVTELYALVADDDKAEAAAESGWDVSLLRTAIKNSYEDAGENSDWEQLQSRMARNSLVEQHTGPKPVSVYQLFWKEFDGSVSMGIILRSAPDEERFLYLATSRFERFEQVVMMFFADIGDGTYHSVRGLGTSIYPHCEVSNRFMNTMVDGAMLSASALLRQKSSNGSSVPKLLRVGPLTVLPPDYDVVDKGFNPNLQGVVEIRNLVQNNLNSNVGLFRPDSGVAGANEKRTAREVTATAQKEAKLENTDIQFYYLQWDRLYAEQLQRVLNPEYGSHEPGYDAAKEFKDRCVQRGVPRDLLDSELLTIKAMRSIGAGSPVMKDINSQELLSLAPYLDRQGKYEAIRNRVIVLAGPENVDRFLGDMDRDEIPVVDSSLARLESGMMELGNKATAGSGEDHVAHATEHLKAVEEYSRELAAAQQRNETPDYTEAATFMRLTLAHVGEHIQFLSGNPAFEEELAALQTGVKQLSRIGDKWQNAAKKQQQEQQQAQAQMQQQAERANSLDAEIEKERIKADMQLQERIHNEERNHQVRSAKAVHGMQLAEEKAQHEMSLAERKAESEMEDNDNA